MPEIAVGRNVAAELARRQMSYAELAAGTGLTVTQLGRRVRGEVDFGAYELARVAAFLGVPVTVLLVAPTEDAP